MLIAGLEMRLGPDEGTQESLPSLRVTRNELRTSDIRTSEGRAHGATKVVSIVGARPNFVKLAPVHRTLVEHFDHIVVHTGQHYDYSLSKIFFQHLNLPDPDYELGVGSGSHGYQVGEMMKKVEEVLLSERPRIALVYGDTNTTLAGALAAAKVRVPVAHVEAGLRCFDMEMPEEVNRVLTDHMSRYLFAPTKTAVENLLREHCQGEVLLTGDVMVETLRDSTKLAERESHVIDDLGLRSSPYILVTVHRAENTDDRHRLSSIVEALTRIEKRVVFPIHPRTVKALEEHGLYGKLTSRRNVTTTQPLGFLDFIKLEKHASMIVTDSGGVQKEAYLLGVPCITLRETTEWVETVREGWNRVVGVDVEKITRAVETFKPRRRRGRVFGTGKASKKIAEALTKAIN